MGTNKSFKILIVDDSQLNREILKSMLEEEYQVEEATNGIHAFQMLDKNGDYDLIILDIVMPEMNGFKFLEEYSKRGYADNIPVIAISAEDSNSIIHSMYELGVDDYITRPFDYKVTKKRVDNSIQLHAKHRNLQKMVEEKTMDIRKTSDLMTSILSHIVEFRNGESGTHVMGIKSVVGIVLEEMLANAEEFEICIDDIPVICDAATLHDIGKISIPDEILNKPGKLTDEEFDIMKSHTVVGSEMLDSLHVDKDIPLIKFAYQICRWHHERYDGKGYPDGLKGDDIPIAAQAVAIADVYDALVSDRCYRKGFSHKEAVDMIINGQCGEFNPNLIKCFKKIEKQLERGLD
jgi:putative two-component system response regulator